MQRNKNNNENINNRNFFVTPSPRRSLFLELAHKNRKGKREKKIMGRGWDGMGWDGMGCTSSSKLSPTECVHIRIVFATFMLYVHVVFL